MELKFMQPMLAGKAPLAHIQFPVYGSAKLDGIRSVIMNGKMMSRKWLSIPNKHTQRVFGVPELERMDGELILGEPTADGVFLRSQSACMTIAGSPSLTFHVFDIVPFTLNLPFSERYAMLVEYVRGEALEERFNLKVVPQRILHNNEEMTQMEEECLALGYEGLMLRSLDGPYKMGRSTTKEGYLLKVKRFEDREAVIVDSVELMRNTNEAFTDEQGFTKRSHAMDGKVPANTLGALVVRDIETNVEFNLGSGYTAIQRDLLWASRNLLPGQIVTYKKFKYGEKDKPRLPIFKGIRSSEDIV